MPRPCPRSLLRVFARALALLALLVAVTAGVGAAAEVEIEEAALSFLGADLHLLVAGPPEGATVLLLHGGRFSSETWRELGTVERLAGAGYRVLALDLPGFGRSTATETPRSDFLAALLPLVAGGPVVVVSPSMSGSFSFPLLARRPGSVAGFVAVAPVGIGGFAKEVERSEVPALLVWGEKDEVVPVGEADRLAAVMPRSRKVILEGAGHACYLDRPDAFHSELLRFLAGLGAP